MRGLVVLVPFPFDDLSAAKLRPAVCLTEPVGPHRHVVVAFVTSRVPAAPEASDLVLDERDAGFAQTGLKVPSALRLHRLVTLSAGVFTRELGRLSAEQEAAVAHRLRRLFRL